MVCLRKRGCDAVIARDVATSNPLSEVKKMDEKTAKRIKKHFWLWSGGFPPESNDQISVYLDGAIPSDIAVPDAELWELLQTWMNEDEPTSADFYAH